VSIVDPILSFSVTATINGHTINFLVDTGSGITILWKAIWESCKRPKLQFMLWCQSKLVGAEGSQLRVFGSATVIVNIEGEEFELFVVVIDPVDLSHRRLITGAGHVVCLNFQSCKHNDCVNDDVRTA